MNKHIKTKSTEDFSKVFMWFLKKKLWKWQIFSLLSFFWWSLFVSDTIDTNTLWMSTSEKYFYERMRCATWFGVKLAPKSLWVIWVMLFCAKKNRTFDIRWIPLGATSGVVHVGFVKSIVDSICIMQCTCSYGWFFFSYHLNAILIEKYEMIHRYEWK